MVTALRLLLVVLATLCLLAVGAWMVADHYATSWVGDTLAQHGLEGVLEVGRVRLPLPNLARATDVNLRDPLTGEIVAHLDEVEVHFAGGVLGALRDPVPEWIAGRGGRVTLTNSHGELTVTRAVEALIDRVTAAAGEPGPAETPSKPFRLPRLQCTDVEALLAAPGTPLESVPGCNAWLDQIEHGVQLNVEGGAGGQVTLRFDGHGLRTLDARAVPVTPTWALFIPDGDFVARDFSPSGRLDLQLQLDPDAPASGHGLLDDASLHLQDVPFPLDHARLPFEFGDNRFRVRDARVGFEGGVLTTNVVRTAGHTSIAVDVVDARFRRQFLDLLPQTEKLEWIRPEDGGNVEVHVQVEDRDESDHLEVKGWGGVLCEHVRFGPTGVDVRDLVGSFDLHGDQLLLHETSGRLASGLVRLHGQLDMGTGAVEVSGSVFDVDVSHLKGAIEPGERGASGISGWLQGEVRYQGNLGSPKDGRGEGEFSVRGGNLWKVPVLDKVLSALGLKDPGSSERHRLAVQFRVRGLRYYVDELRLQSDLISLRGTGRVSRDGALDVDIIPISVPLGPLGDLLEYVQSQFVRLELRGTLVAPEVTVRVIKVVTKPVGQLWDWVTGLFGSEEPAPDAAPDAAPAEVPAEAPAGEPDAERALSPAAAPPPGPA